MCKIGDIILVDSYMDHGKTITKHSFVVISDDGGEIEGCPYDIIANVLSSFKNEKQKERKLNYPGNFPIANEDTITNPDNGESGYLKTDQLYFFKKDKITYTTIGYVKAEIFDLIIEFINESNFDVVAITDNLISV